MEEGRSRRGDARCGRGFLLTLLKAPLEDHRTGENMEVQP